MSAMEAYTTSSSFTNDTGVNMSKVELHDDIFVNCSISNVSGFNDPRCDKSGNGISLVAPLSMMTLGVLGNIFALIIIYSSRAEAQGRRTVFFVMLSGLAWIDVMAQLCVSPIAILVYVNNMVWIGGAHLCRYHGFVMTSFGLITPLIVSCMSVERLIAIRFSYFYARHITQRRAVAAFFLCILGPLIFSSFPFIGFGSYELQYPSSWCFLNFHRESTVDAIYAGIFSCINISAIFVMLFCNISVVVTLFIMRQSRKVNKSPSFDRRISVTQISNSGGAVIRSRKHSDMEAQMIWFLCLITIAFSVCWLPFNVHILGNQFTGQTNHVLDLVFVRMVGCNQILDPWLYVIFRKSSFMRLLGYIKRIFNHKRRPEDDLLHEALKNQDLRRRSLNRSSTMEVTTLNRTVGTGRGANSYLEDNLENLKKILENERKLGRDIMYSKISEKTEYSADSLAHLDSCVADCCIHASHNQDREYGSIRSCDRINYTNETKKRLCGYMPESNTAHHKPCTNTKSCPIRGSEPMVSNDLQESTTYEQHQPIGRQLSVPTPSISIFKDLISTQLCASTVHESVSSSSLASEKVDGHWSKSTTPAGSSRHLQNHGVNGVNKDEDEGSCSNDEVFEENGQETSRLCPDVTSERNSSNDHSKPKANNQKNSFQNLPNSSTSDSQGLLT